MEEYRFWRDSNHKEIDLIVQQADKFDIYEIKSTTTITHKLFADLNYFSVIAPELVKNKFLIYEGQQSQKRTSAEILSWKDC